jgi:hypothetical protein
MTPVNIANKLKGECASLHDSFLEFHLNGIIGERKMEQTNKSRTAGIAIP